MRFADEDEFFKSFLEPFPVDEFFRTAAGGTDANDTVIGNAVETVAPRLGCSPADVVDNCMTANHTIPIAESSHPICIPVFQGNRKVLICREIWCDYSGEMTKNSIRTACVKPNSVFGIKLMVIFVKANISHVQKVFVSVP